MKNLKKVLSLALAFAMVLGLCVTGMAAQDVTTLTDWDQVRDQRAVRTLNAFSIMEGDSDGNFYPDKPVSRVEAAALLSRAIWGGADDPALYGTGNPKGYTDVVVGSWYMGYVNFMYIRDIMVGDSAEIGGTFRPDETVSGYELLKMCLVALGYDPDAEKLTGNGWDMRVMDLATLHNYADLTYGTDVVDWSAPLSRMNAAIIIENMIWRQMVTYTAEGIRQDLTQRKTDNVNIVEDVTFSMYYLNAQQDEYIVAANEYSSIDNLYNGTLRYSDGNLSGAGVISYINEYDRYYDGENAIIYDITGDSLNYAVTLDPETQSVWQVGFVVDVIRRGSGLLSYYVRDAVEMEPSFADGDLANADLWTKNDAANYIRDEGYAKLGYTIYIDDCTTYTDDKGVTDTATWDDFGEWSNWGYTFTPDNDVVVKYFDTDLDNYIDTVKVYTMKALKTKKVITDADGNTWYDFNNNGKVNAYPWSGNDRPTSVYEVGNVPETRVAEGVELTTVFNGYYIYGYVLETVEGGITRLSTKNDDGLHETVYIDGVATANSYNNNVVTYGAEGTFFFWQNGTIESFAPFNNVTATTYAIVYDGGYETWGSSTALAASNGVIVEVVATLDDGTTGTFEVNSVSKVDTSVANTTKITTAYIADQKAAVAPSTSDPSGNNMTAIETKHVYNPTTGETTTTVTETGIELPWIFGTGLFEKLDTETGGTPDDKDYLVSYTLTEDGKIDLTFISEVNTGRTPFVTQASSVTEVKKGVSTISTTAGTKYFTESSVTFVETEPKTDLTAKKTETWVAYSGSTTPDYKFESGKKVDLLTGDLYAAGDGLAVAAAVLTYGDIPVVSGIAADFYYILNNADIVGQKGNKYTYQVDIYNAETGEVEEGVTYEGTNAVKAGELYTTFNSVGGFMDKIEGFGETIGTTDVAADQGFIASYANNLIHLKVDYKDNNDDDDGEDDDSVTVGIYEVTSDTKFFYVDGEESFEMEAGDIVLQEVLESTANKNAAGTITDYTDRWQTMIVYEKGTNEALLVIVFDAVQTYKTPVGATLPVAGATR